MGSYTQIATLGAQHRARTRPGPAAPKPTSDGIETAAAYVCPGCGDVSHAPSTCDACALPFTTVRDSVAVTPPREGALGSGAGEVRAGLWAMLAVSPFAVAAVLVSLADLGAEQLPGVVSWPLTGTMMVAAASVALTGALAAVVARRVPAMRARFRGRGRGQLRRAGILRVRHEDERAQLVLVCDDGAQLRLPALGVRVDGGARVRLADGDSVEVFGALDTTLSPAGYRGLEVEAAFVGDDVRVRLRG